jgi:hypothetical protein
MPKHTDAVTRLREFITPAFKQLSIVVSPEQLDEITELVGNSMMGAGRYFHNPEHVIHVGSGGDALSVLGAFFHDLVYFQVDQGVSLNVARHIAPFVQEKQTALCIRRDIPFDRYPFAKAVMGIFGFQAGDLLPPNNGQNEFLSAFAAGSVLSAYTNLSQIVQIAVCIEATIPFRGPDASGMSPTEALVRRLRKVNEELKLKFPDTELRAMVRRAVKMANQDVSNFGGESSARFLKNTWELVPEINPLLRSPSSYSVDGYRTALLKMESFFATLDPARVFQRFDGEPTEEIYAGLVANATSHVNGACEYFRLKLVSLAMLEALSGTLGKNLGLPFLMGELSNLGSPEDRVEKFLPLLEGPSTRNDAKEARLLRLLEKDEEREEAGLRSSPLTAFLVRKMGLGPMLEMWPRAEAFFRDPSETRDFLQSFPTETLGLVSDAVSVLLQRRAHRITTFVGSLATPSV